MVGLDGVTHTVLGFLGLTLILITLLQASHISFSRSKEDVGISMLVALMPTLTFGI